MSDESDNATKYEFEPFEQVFLTRREQILELVTIADYALRSMEGSARLAKALKKPPDYVRTVQELEDRAAAQIQAEFPLLNGAASVLVWGALETAIRDFAIRWLTVRPNVLFRPAFKNLRVRVSEYENLKKEDRMRYVIDILERDGSAALKPGIGRFATILEPMGIGTAVSDDRRRDLHELAAVRNVIVHRAGIADLRFVELCPWLGIDKGDAVVVTRSSFVRYVEAASEYAASIVESAESIVAEERDDDAAKM